MAKVVPAIASNLQTISDNLLANNALTSVEHDQILFPEHDHTTACLNMILTEIDGNIKEDSRNLDKFVDMLRGMGTYYKHVCDALTMPDTEEESKPF